MSAWEKIAGTVVQWFGLGGEEEVAVGKDASGNLVFKDQVVSGTPTLSELVDSSEGDDQVKIVVEDGDTFRVKPDHQHIVFDFFTVEGDGIYQVEGESVIFGGRDPQIFDAFDGAGGTSIGTSWTDVPLTNQALSSGSFFHDTPGAAVLVRRKGTYKVCVRAGTGIASGTSRSDSEVRLVKSTGGAYAEVPGSRGFMYNRTDNAGENSTSFVRYLELDNGDSLKVQVRKETGASNLELLANASGISLEKAS